MKRSGRLLTAIIHTILLANILTLHRCQDPTEKPKRDTSIFIQANDVWAYSTEIEISVADTSDSWSFALFRDDSLIVSGTVRAADTTIADESLSMNSTYSYKAYFMDGSEHRDSTDVLHVQTMERRSHDISWTIERIGLSGRLYAVDAVSEDNIWVVGDFYKADTNDADKSFCNTAHWDGEKWNLMSVYWNTPLYSVKYFNQKNIWLTSLGYPYHWDGSLWTLYRFPDLGVDGSAGRDTWADSPDNMYFAGYDLVHYNGTSFRKIETDWTLLHRKVTGSQTHILSTGWSLFSPVSELTCYDISKDMETVLFRDTHFTGMAQPDSIAGPVTDVMSSDAYRFLLLTNYGLYLWDSRNGEKKFPAYLLDPERSHRMFTALPEAMDGTGFNDLFIVGHFSMIYHFDGEEYTLYPDLTERALYWDVSVTEHLVVVVGSDENGKPIVVKGVR